MKKRIILLSKTIVFIFIFIISASAEYVFIKNGAIINCTVLRDAADSITVRLGTGKTDIIYRRDIIRILYTELYMGKVYVQQTNGTGLEVYMVDEDRSEYTFRKELYKPAEFKLRRDEVLFIARKNPTGLRGEPETDRIKLTWQPPYNVTKKFIIYIKDNIKADYKKIDDTTSKEYTVKGVKSNTEYRVIVTAIDTDNYESLPSNEIKVTTLNILPDPPKKVRAVKKVEAGGKATASLTWLPAIDPDGVIKSYNIYQKDKKGFVPAGKTDKTQFEAKNLDPNKNYYFYIRAVDDKNGESGDSRLVNTLDVQGYDVSLQPSYIIPFGTFKNINKMGFGALINVTKKDLLLEDLDLGVALGYWQFKGASDVDQSYMIPLLGTANYRIEVYPLLFIIPRIALGFSYISLSYKVESELYTGYGIIKDKKDKKGIEPLGFAGISINYGVTDYWFISAGADYGIIYETGGSMNFLVISMSAGRKF